MIIEHVNDFNQRQSIKYHEDCDKWRPCMGGFPQIALYIFYKKYGYVASGGGCAIWRKTKKAVISAWKETHGDD